MSLAILTDTTKCIGCRECVAACKSANHLPADLPRRWDVDDGLSARNWTSIVEGPDHAFVRKQCRHCEQPACASACPVGALHKTETGAVVYDRDKCMGCRYCMMACPYGIPRYDWDQATPYVRKCILCYDRVQSGKQPACTEACPSKATIFGDRDRLLAEAHQRIGEKPGSYIDKVWGEAEVGGTSVLYVSTVDLTFLNEGKSLGSTPLPATTAAAMNAVPFAFTGMLGVMGGLHWLAKRRAKVREEESNG